MWYAIRKQSFYTSLNVVVHYFLASILSDVIIFFYSFISLLIKWNNKLQKMLKIYFSEKMPRVSPTSHSDRDREHTSSLNFDERSWDVVNLGEICNFHVCAMLLLRHWQVLTVPNTFLLGSYNAPIMRAQGRLILAMSKKIALCVYHILSVSFQSLQIQKCTMTRATSFILD